MLRTNEIADLCRATLKSKTSSDEEKRRAKKSLRRYEKMDLQRKEAIKAVGNKPKRQDFDSDEAYGEALRVYRNELDKHCIQRDAYGVLDNPASSMRCRINARQRLASIGIVEDIAPIEAPAPQTQAKQPTVTSSKYKWTESEYAAERRREREFLDEIARLTAEDAAKKKENESVNSGSTK
jgi:hypothetical protein